MLLSFFEFLKTKCFLLRRNVCYCVLLSLTEDMKDMTYSKCLFISGIHSVLYASALRLSRKNPFFDVPIVQKSFITNVFLTTPIATLRDCGSVLFTNVVFVERLPLFIVVFFVRIPFVGKYQLTNVYSLCDPFFVVLSLSLSLSLSQTVTFKESDVFQF
jgi:hypothetical protein